MSSWWLILLPLSPLPIGADRKVRRTPWVTYVLLAANFAVYLVTMPDRNPDAGALFQRWGVVPGDFRPITLVTSLFIHTGLVHLCWNELFLWVFGPLAEDAVGPVMFLIVYFGGGACGGLLHCRVTTALAAHSAVFAAKAGQPLVGASGAISSILAPFAIRYHRSNIRLVWLPAYVLRRELFEDLQLPAVYVIAFLVLENIGGAVYGWLRPQSGGVAYWAHLGGFAFGYAVAGLTGLFLEGTREYLLEDARAAVQRGAAGFPTAVRKYQALLQLEPKNLPVRLEYASALASMARSSGSRATLAQAVAEVQSAAVASLAAGDLPRMVEIVALSRRLDLPVEIPPRDRLRIATAAQEMGDRLTAIALLETMLTGPASATPRPPLTTECDDEIARLRLGQLLVDVDPVRAAAVLDSLIERYPDSDWIRMARQLRSLVKSQ